VARTDPALAFVELERGAILGTLLSLTFAGIAIALAARQFLIKPVEALQRTMARAELGDALVRAKVLSEDELGKLAKSFNTMLSRITDMEAHELETQESMHELEREVGLQKELREANEALEAHIAEIELLLEVAKGLSGAQGMVNGLEAVGQQLCARMQVDGFSVVRLDEARQDLVVSAVAGSVPMGARLMRFRLGEGITGAAVAKGETLYVPDVEKDPRYLHYKGVGHDVGSFVAVPLRWKGHVIGSLNVHRRATSAFTPKELRLTEAVAAQAALLVGIDQLERDHKLRAG
jgi:signal transduction protein with GAF and PtsI domain